MNKEKGIYIPFEFFENKELNNSERIVLALYKYFCEKGKYKCCSLSNQQIAEKLNTSRRNVIDIKNHLKELGLIKSENERKVVYVDYIVNQSSPEAVSHTSLPSEPELTTTSELQLTRPVSQSSLINVKKNKKEKKEIKKDEEMNLNLVIDKLPSYYRTDEMISYIKEVYGERIDNLDIENESDFDMMVDIIITQVKNSLVNNFLQPKQEEEEEVKKQNNRYIDLFD